MLTSASCSLSLFLEVPSPGSTCTSLAFLAGGSSLSVIALLMTPTASSNVAIGAYAKLAAAALSVSPLQNASTSAS